MKKSTEVRMLKKQPKQTKQTCTEMRMQKTNKTKNKQTNKQKTNQTNNNKKP